MKWVNPLSLIGAMLLVTATHAMAANSDALWLSHQKINFKSKVGAAAPAGAGVLATVSGAKNKVIFKWNPIHRW